VVAPDTSKPVEAIHFGAVWLAVHVFELPSASEAIAAPVVGEIVSVPSLLVIEVTPDDPPPKHALVAGTHVFDPVLKQYKA
jgi:hypothetical protein